MTSGYVAIGDVRNIAETLYQEDYVGARMNSLGFVPLVGDGGQSLKADISLHEDLV